MAPAGVFDGRGGWRRDVCADREVSIPQSGHRTFLKTCVEVVASYDSGQG